MWLDKSTKDQRDIFLPKENMDDRTGNISHSFIIEVE